MKRKISVILILTMMLSVFSVFAYADGDGAGQAARALDDKAVHTFVNKMRGNIKGLKGDFMQDALKLKIAMDKLEKGVIAEGILDIIRESEFGQLLRDEYGVDSHSKQLIIDNAKDVRRQVGLEYLYERLTTGDDFGEDNKLADIKIRPSEDAKTAGELANEVAEDLLEDEGIKNVYERLNPVSDKSKAEIAVEITELVIENIDMSLTSPYKLTINDEKILAGANDILEKDLNVDTKFKEEDADKLKDLIDDTIEDFTDTQKRAVARVIAVAQGKNPYKDHGGGGPITPPEKDEPKVEIEDGKAEVELGKEAVETKIGDKNQSIVKIKEDNVEKAIDALEKAIKKDPNLVPRLTVKLDDVKTLDAEISIPAGALTKLDQNKIGLIIQSKALVYEIPSKALEDILKDAPKGSYIEFISSAADKTEIEKLIKDEFIKNVARAIDLQSVLKDSQGNAVKTIDKFGSKIKIAVEIDEKDGNPDLLAAFHVDEETGTLEFVGGKIKDNKITITTDHYSKFAVVEYNKGFEDIEGHWSEDYVKSMVAKHVIDGFEDGTYRPEDLLTRAQFAKLLVDAMEPDMISYNKDFEDVDSDHWAKDYIATAKHYDIIIGYEDGTFGPERNIDRSEMATMIVNSLKLDKNSDLKVLQKFEDLNEIPDWAVGYMGAAVEEGLLIGSNGTLNPLGNTTRAEAATIIYRIYNR